jgi:transcriptional regulator with XRE-family HTH domain
VFIPLYKIGRIIYHNTAKKGLCQLLITIMYVTSNSGKGNIKGTKEDATFMLGDWITEHLTANGWSQRELARRAGISHANISNVVSGQRPSTWDFCAAIAGPFGVSPIVVFRKANLLRGGNLQQVEAEYYATTMTDDEALLLETYRQLSEAARPYVLATVAGIKDFSTGK